MRNKVELIGRVGRVTVHEKNATFSLATTYTRRSDGEKQTSTEWHNLVAFGSERDLVKNFVSPGRFLHVEGHLKTSHWEEGNHKFQRTDVVVEQILFLDARPKSGEEIPDSHDAVETSEGAV